MNSYTITSIDQINKEVKADYVYNGHKLSDLIPTDDFSDLEAITNAVISGYDNFVSQMNALDAQPDLPNEIVSKIGIPQEV